MKNRKVLHILNEIHCSGLEQMLFASREEWRNFNMNCSILATGLVEGPFAKSMRAAGYEIFHIPYINRKKFAFFEEILFLYKNRYFAVHVHTEGCFLLHVLAAYLTGHRNIIRTFHSVFSPSFLGRMRRRADRVVAEFLGVKFVSIGESVSRNEKNGYNTRTIVCPNWYNDHVFKRPTCSYRKNVRGEFGIDEDTFVVLSVGNCLPVKRHELLIRGLALLPQSVKWKYFHIGTGELEEKEKILVNQLGLKKKCFFKGRQELVYQYLVLCDLYVMPSSHEGFSIAALEAFGTGRIGLLADVPGLIDFKNLFEGVFYFESNPFSLANKIVEIVALSEDEAKRLEEKNITSASTCFSIDSGVRRYVSVYERS